MVRNMIEALEDRRYFAVTAVLSSGTLTVTGTTSNDAIVVKEQYGNATVTSGSKSLGTFSSVKVVKIIGGAGNDTLTYTGYDVGAYVEGDAGDDTINVTDYSPSTATHTYITARDRADKLTVFASYGGGNYRRARQHKRQDPSRQR